MNDLYKSGTSMLMDDLCVDNNLLNEEIETLKQENDKLRITNDDVTKQFSKEICLLKQRLEWCQAQSIDMELKFQSQNNSNSCQLCKNNESLKSLCLKYEKESADLKIENVEWQQNHEDIKYCNGVLDSNIQDKNHIIIDLKEKIKLLQ